MANTFFIPYSLVYFVPRKVMRLPMPMPMPIANSQCNVNASPPGPCLISNCLGGYRDVDSSLTRSRLGNVCGVDSSPSLTFQVQD